MADETELLVGFARALRAEGVATGTGAVTDFCRASALLGFGGVYWAGRATLISRHEDIEVYDRVFARFLGGAPPPAQRPPRLRVIVPRSIASGEGEASDPEPATVGRASRVELLRRKSFDRCSPEELAELATIAAGFARTLPRRRSRRRHPAATGWLDLPETLRRSLRTGGEPFERRFQARRAVARPVVVLLDISGSMSSTSRALLVLAHALVHVHPPTQVLCFGTRLTHVTRALAVRDVDEALRNVTGEVADWEGGTRIGESLKAFLDGRGHRSAARGAIVVVCSDGLDVGDAELLRAQMERLSRLARRVVWLNPLKQDPAYEPLARGMQAALPYVNVLASGHNLASLEWAARQLSGRSRG